MDGPTPPLDVAVIGGGISGLTAARALCARGFRVRLFERDARCGGLIETDRPGGFVIDTGPDTLLAHKPAALLAGLHRGDASRLSMQALFPMLARAERDHGSVARAWRKMPARAGGGSMSLRQGLDVIPERLLAGLPPHVVLTGAAVARITPDRPHRIVVEDGSSVTARAVLLATPAHACARMLERTDPALSRACASIAYRAAITVALGYRSTGVKQPLYGWGFVVPGAERRHVRSASWVTSKWPGRAPSGCTLLRLSLHGDDRTLSRSDASLLADAHEDTRRLLAINGDPVLARVDRRPLAMPQLEVGHLERMAAIDAALVERPGLFVSAAGFRGVGLPDCIANARAVAGRAAEFVNGQPTASTAA